MSWRRCGWLLWVAVGFGATACDGDGMPAGRPDLVTTPDSGNPVEISWGCEGMPTCVQGSAPECTADRRAFRVCVHVPNGCWVLSDPLPCRAGTACVDGQCEVCTPDCTGRVCGDDGCGGSCGPACPDGVACVAGQCETGCTPACDDRECGPDGCGGVCGDCAANEVCLWDGTCFCVPACANLDCGDDGCGGSCGQCAAGVACTAGRCAGGCTTNCTGRVCGDDGCGGSCGNCPSGQSCTAGQCVGCTPNCGANVCGDDGCGGSCGNCPFGQSCSAGQCVGCTPSCAGRVCGDDGCGGSCGNCGSGQTCEAGQCSGCAPDCAGRQCGDDGCGGVCGTCAAGWTCSADGSCRQPPPFVCQGQSTPSQAGCAQVVSEQGCCDPWGRVVWCQGGNTYCIDCAGILPACGWNGSENANYYDCGQNGAADPRGVVPIHCPGIACTPSCAGRRCGDDGCGGSCGFCAAGETCAAHDCTQATLQACPVLVACLNEACTHCQADDADCIFACAVDSCIVEYAQCFYFYGALSCQGLYDCVGGCGTNQTCAQNCIANASMSGFIAMALWEDCLYGECPVTLPDTQWQTCAETAANGTCADAYTACFGG